VANAVSGNDVAEQVAGLAAAGLMLAAYDTASAALEAGADDDRLRLLALGSLARSGATAAALLLFQRWGLEARTDPDIRALYARLLKDIALDRMDTEAAATAASAYTDVWRSTAKPWLGVNAAAMALLGGSAAAARELAQAVGEVADGGDYWSAATAAERALLLGDAETAARWLERAEARAGSDLTRRATMRRQLRWECGLLGIDPALADILHIPTVLTYCGQVPVDDGPAGAAEDATAALAAPVAAAVEQVGFAYGGLAAGADIIIAEALLRRGVQLSVFLPFPAEAFEALSVQPAGAAWVPRFRACLAAARVAVLEPAPHDDWSLALAARRAMGLARLQARALQTEARQLAVWDGAPPRAAAGTAVDIAAWRAAGLPTDVIPSPWPRPPPGRPAPRPAREPRAALFGDLPSFGRLDEAGLADFYRTAMAALGAAVDRERPDYRNAWGDAVQCVFAHPNAAARCALGIRAALTAENLAAMGLPGFLTPRLALDHGALLPVHDPVQRCAKYAGTVMTRAARIEPVTPPGRSYATEAFACEMALEPFPAVRCDYAGLTRTAKEYGTLPLYLVRAAGRRS
jgi:uncharacterized protein YjiS (DUF1127 family)